MFRKSRRKIVASIMAVLVLLWIGTLCLIYGSSYLEVSRRNREMLERHVSLYRLPGQSPALSPETAPERGGGKPDPGIPRFEDTPAFQLSTFYSVALSDGGEILSVTNPKISIHDDGELEEMARLIAAGSKSTGMKNSLIYRKADKGGYTLVAFMDNTIVRESMTTLFRYTLIFGGTAILLLFFLAVHLARKIVEPLEESHRRQRQFISDAGHELKTPIAVVSTNVELLSRQIGENPWLLNIQYENKRMHALVTQLLDLARTEQAVTPMGPVDFSRLVAGEALPFESLMFEQSLVFSCDIADGVCVHGNATQLGQVTAILLDNALRHCPPGKAVLLSLKKGAHGQAILSVLNDGDPIPEAEQAQIFERFYRGDPSRTDEPGHYGLGLAIARAIALSHHGKIGVRCHDGKVEFTVTLPPPKGKGEVSYSYFERK